MKTLKQNIIEALKRIEESLRSFSAKSEYGHALLGAGAMTLGVLGVLTFGLLIGNIGSHSDSINPTKNASETIQTDKTVGNTTKPLNDAVAPVKTYKDIIANIPKAEISDSQFISCIQNSTNACILTSVMNKATLSMDTAICKEIPDPNQKVYCEDSIISAIATKSKNPMDCIKSSDNTRVKCAFDIAVLLGKEKHNNSDCGFINKVANITSVVIPEMWSKQSCEKAIEAKK